MAFINGDPFLGKFLNQESLERLTGEVFGRYPDAMLMPNAVGNILIGVPNTPGVGWRYAGFIDFGFEEVEWFNDC